LDILDYGHKIGEFFSKSGEILASTEQKKNPDSLFHQMSFFISSKSTSNARDHS
jgi:hypothetical protein